MIITLIPLEALVDVWPKAEGFIRNSLDEVPGYYRVSDILHNILSEKESLWGVFDEDGTMIAAITTVINEYPLCRRLCIHQVGGTRANEWYEDFFSVLKNYAADVGCDYIDGGGRAGWAAFAKKEGVERGYTYSYKITAED